MVVKIQIHWVSSFIFGSENQFNVPYFGTDTGLFVKDNPVLLDSLNGFFLTVY